MRLCKASPAHFLRTCGQVYDATARAWQPFDLWPAQEDALARFHQHPLTVVLKARQLGLSWLCCGWALYLMLFQPAATVLFFSQRDTEATHLLNFRVRGMLDRVPAYMQPQVLVDNAHELRLASGSTALAFPTTGGRSYTASLAIVDEADHTQDLDGLLNAVKPTIDAGGRLILLSTADKSRPESPFKRIFRAAQESANAYHPIFLPWSARPGRTPEWYEQQRADVLARTGALDDLHQEYPADPLEALAARTLDRRFAVEWITACSELQVESWKVESSPYTDLLPSTCEPATVNVQPATFQPATDLPGLTVFAPPVPEAAYVVGADPAEGNPQSDESAATVLDQDGRQVAVLAGRFDPAVFAAHLESLSARYNHAPILVERNNHGHAVLLWLREFGSAQLLAGYDGKPGWLQSGRGKALCLDTAAEVFAAGAAVIRDRTTAEQLASIEGATLRAPAGQHDDRAIAFCLALTALRFHPPTTTSAPALAARPRDPIREADRAPWRSAAW